MAWGSQYCEGLLSWGPTWVAKMEKVALQSDLSFYKLVEAKVFTRIPRQGLEPRTY